MRGRIRARKGDAGDEGRRRCQRHKLDSTDEGRSAPRWRRPSPPRGDFRLAAPASGAADSTASLSRQPKPSDDRGHLGPPAAQTRVTGLAPGPPPERTSCQVSRARFPADRHRFDDNPASLPPRNRTLRTPPLCDGSNWHIFLIYGNAKRIVATTFSHKGELALLQLKFVDDA